MEVSGLISDLSTGAQGSTWVFVYLTSLALSASYVMKILSIGIPTSWEHLC